MISPIEPLTDIRTGTSGYDYPEWEGVLYSKGIGPKGYLGAYSEVFNTLELGFSRSGMPKSEKTRDLMTRTRTANHDDECQRTHGAGNRGETHISMRSTYI
jgi:hypothetical protein